MCRIEHTQGKHLVSFSQKSMESTLVLYNAHEWYLNMKVFASTTRYPIFSIPFSHYRSRSIKNQRFKTMIIQKANKQDMKYRTQENFDMGKTVKFDES